MSLTMVIGGAPFGSFGAVSLSWPTEASPVLPVPRALTGVGRAALRNGEKGCQEIGSAPDCRPTVAHPPKVMTHRPEGRAGPRSSRSRAGRAGVAVGAAVQEPGRRSVPRGWRDLIERIV